MGVNTELAGRSYPPSEPYVVPRERILAFATAVGAEDPIHFDQRAAREAGHADVIAPPTFAVVVAQQCEFGLVKDPEAGIDFSRVVHGEEGFEYHRPIVAGDALVGTLHIDSIREAGGHAMLTSRVELATESGDAVATVRSTIVVRGED